MEVISRSQDRLSPEYSEMLFKRHLQGALVRSGASLIMGLFAVIGFYMASIKSHHLAGVGFSILFLILINPPTLWILKKIKSRLVYRYFSLLINFLEIIGYTGIIYSLGGIEATYLTPIYAALITYVGTVSPRGFPFIVAALCALAFSSMVTLEYLGYLPRQSVVSDFRLPLGTQMIYVSVVMALLFVTAYISAYTASALKRIRNKLHMKNIELQGSVRTMSREVTERKQAEEALRESEEKYRTILESIEEGYFEVDIAGNFTFFNDSLCEIFGFPKDELMGMNNRQYTDEENAKELYETLNRVYTTGKPDKGFDWEIIRKDGTKRSVEASVSLREDAEGEPIGFRGVIRDISEKQRLEARLQQTQKMETIGTLAGGIAHEFNNALMGIMGNLELFKMDLSEDERTDKYFEAMHGSGHRMSRLTDQLLAYSEGGKYQPKNLKLDDFVIETLPILQHDLNPTVKIETHFEKDISYIKADYTQMQMLLSAILANSNEAIEDEGLIRITAENKDVDEDFTKQHPGLKLGSYACLTIEDDGNGMDEETRIGIFEPFFTTKFQGRGMGMAAVYGIVKNHGGWISVDSKLGKGTAVQIYLPAIEIEIGKSKKAKVEVTTGSGTILMIEDEDVVIEVTQAMLEMLGYRVMVAKTGKEAIHITETFDGQIDLALLDIKLTDMEGGKVYLLIMQARPNLKVIVFSGYSIDGPARKILDAGAQDFIQKPFSLATLSEKLKEVLEGK